MQPSPGPEQMKIVFNLIVDILENKRQTEEVKKDVIDLAGKFPLYEDLNLDY